MVASVSDEVVSDAQEVEDARLARVGFQSAVKAFGFGGSAVGAEQDIGEGHNVEQPLVPPVVVEMDGRQSQSPIAALLVAEAGVHTPAAAVGVVDLGGRQVF